MINLKKMIKKIDKIKENIIEENMLGKEKIRKVMDYKIQRGRKSVDEFLDKRKVNNG